MLPDDLIAYLSNPKNRTLALGEGEVRELTFFAPESIPLGRFDVSSDGLHCIGLSSADVEDRREYDAHDLIASCDGYEPQGILAWFPEWQRYGPWDCDHHTIMTYPDVTWTQIAAAPTWYVNGQWYPEKVRHEMVNPWA